MLLLSLLALIGCCSGSPAQQQYHGRVFGAYFEEWGTRYTGYNISDLQKSGVAYQLTYLLYAFGNVTSSSTPACAIADPVAAYGDSSVPSVSGKPYLAPPYGHFGAILQLKQLHPSLKVLISLGGQLGNAGRMGCCLANPRGPRGTRFLMH